MAGHLSASVEVLKLAQLVGAKPDKLVYLHDVEPQDIRGLREQVTDVLFDADRQMLQRVVAAQRLIPAGLTATLGERAFGPLLCARLTGLLEPERAVDIAARLPTKFLADLAVQLDPRRASRVIAQMPPRQIAEITRELARRKEYIVMGGFVGHLSEEATKAALAVIDDAALLRTAYVVESKGSLGSLVALLSPERLDAVIRTATAADLWTEAIDVMGHLPERQRGALADLAAGHEDAVLEGLVRAAQRDLLWRDVLPITGAMSPASRARFTALPSLQTRPVLAAIVDAARQHELWPEVLVLLPLLPARARRTVAALGTSFGRPVLANILAAAHEEQLWPALVRFATELNVATQKQIAALIAASDDDVLAALLAAVEADGLATELDAAIYAHLGGADLKRLTVLHQAAQAA